MANTFVWKIANLDREICRMDFCHTAHWSVIAISDQVDSDNAYNSGAYGRLALIVPNSLEEFDDLREWIGWQLCRPNLVREKVTEIETLAARIAEQITPSQAAKPSDGKLMQKISALTR